MSRRAGRRFAVGAVVALAAAGAAAAPTDATPHDRTPAAPLAMAPGLTLVSHRFNVPADGFVDMVLGLPGSIDAGTLATTFPDSAVVITAYRPLGDRAAVLAALDGTLPRSVDSVDLTLTGLSRPAPEQLALTVAVEVGTRTPTALQLPEPGLYPITIEVRGNGDVLAELTTFVHRLPAVDEPPLRELPVAIAVATTRPVMLDDDQAVILDDATLAELEELADVLEASAMPLAVRFSPAVLAALPDGGARAAAVGERLRAALAGPLGHEVLSAPALPLDPSQAAATGAGDLYGDWLRDGEDLLADLGTSGRRTATVIDPPLSQAGAALLRTLGSRLLVLPVEWYDGLPNSFGIYTDSSLLVSLDVGDSTTVSATVVDRSLDDLLARPTANPLLTAVHVAADLLAARTRMIALDDDPQRHGITLGTPDLSLPDPGTLGVVTSLLAATPGLEPITLDDLSVRADSLLFEGAEVVVGLPRDVPGTDLGSRLALTTDLRLEAISTGSMLPGTDPRLTSWTRLIDLVVTSAITDEQVAAIASRLRAEYQAVREMVVPPEGFSFTLTGRRGEVPVTLQNTGDTTIAVVVRMTSPKLLFPSGDTVVELPPGEFKEVRIPIEARSNGKFPVTLEVLTPIGEVRLGPPVPLTARVSALSGLGPLLTGAAALVVLAWWMRHVRMSRRTKSAESAIDRHPATAATATATAAATAAATNDDPGMSPDAAATTLPPS